MKPLFSTHWKASTQRRKQRKYRAHAPLHIKGKFLNSPLSKELRKKYQKRSFRVKKGDRVRVTRGQFKGHTGKIERVDVKRTKLYIEKLDVTKKDGSKTFYPIHPSKVMILDLNLDDQKRKLKLTGGEKTEQTPKRSEH
ncbi:50S ribosomal protein L24 [Candidatus Woesearchaeota archaeon]|nr:50S ribosomal protein L24 [Candidatus Woesearchaeota archaeon]